MDLGEQIHLEGFEEREAGELLIAKKLIGNHVKAIIERSPGFERLDLRLEYAAKTVSVNGSLVIAGHTKTSAATDANVFFALDSCLKELSR